MSKYRPCYINSNYGTKVLASPCMNFTFSRNNKNSTCHLRSRRLEWTSLLLCSTVVFQTLMTYRSILSIFMILFLRYENMLLKRKWCVAKCPWFKHSFYLASNNFKFFPRMCYSISILSIFLLYCLCNSTVKLQHTTLLNWRNKYGPCCWWLHIKVYCMVTVICTYDTGSGWFLDPQIITTFLPNHPQPGSVRFTNRFKYSEHPCSTVWGKLC